MPTSPCLVPWLRRVTTRRAISPAAALFVVVVLPVVTALPPAWAGAQQPPVARVATGPMLRLADAMAAARLTSPELRAAREAVLAARARERQAGALLNPTLAYGHEQTSRAGQSNAQDIAQFEQPLEIGGQRGARRNAARLRRELAEARLTVAERQLDFDVTRAYATLAAAARRANLTEEASAAFVEAGRVSAQRLAAGDLSGYAARRLQLETARYAAQRADAMLALRVARLELAMLMTVAPESVAPSVTASATPATDALPSLDSLRAAAVSARADVRALKLEAAATGADTRLASAERIPTPTLSAGYKRERATDRARGSDAGLHGFVAGFSLPLPVFDRRVGDIAAASADTRRREAETDALERRVRLEVGEAYAALQAADTQLGLLQPQLGENARAALRAVQAAYTEGEITLVEWLDAVRAYQEAESTFATLQADAMIRRAALERAVGISLFARSDR